MAKRLGTFKKILAETLLLSSDKVALARKNVFFTLACFARQTSAGRTDNQQGSLRTVLHEGEKAKVEWEGDRGEGRLPLR